jgi:type IV pilus assembly protein PilV
MQKNYSSQSGVALLEALISAIIIAIGLLGLAALQVVTNRQSNHTNYAYLAALQIYDMADRMHANSVGVSTGSYNNLSGIPSSAAICSGVVSCNPAQLAMYDSAQWNTANAALLPSGTGTVTGNGSNFTVNMQWREPQIGTRTLSMIFRI